MKRYVNAMDKFGLIGFPIGHSRSPELFAGMCGGKWEYDLLEFDSFDDSWKAFKEGPYRAVNVTSPYKGLAAEISDIRSAAVERTGSANIVVKTEDGNIAAFNSDYLAVKQMLHDIRPESVTVIGLGGAGRSAMVAAETLGLAVRGFHHNEITDRISSDVIVFTLPAPVPGCEKMDCRILIEANYKNPCLSNHPGYISGLEWLRLQAMSGYEIMTGEKILYREK